MWLVPLGAERVGPYVGEGLPVLGVVVVDGVARLGLLDVPLDDEACWLVLGGGLIFGVADDACFTGTLRGWGASLLRLGICESS